MLLKMEQQFDIKAPARTIWRVLAHEYQHMDRWCSLVKSCLSVTDGAVSNGHDVSGRICDQVQENFVYYDDRAMCFGYQAQHPPLLMRKAANSWRVQAIDDNRSRVFVAPEIDAHPVLALLIRPLIKLMGQRVIEELIYYLEQGKPHPRKLKQLKSV